MKFYVVLILVIAMLFTGCGKQDADVSSGTQMTEDSQTLEDSQVTEESNKLDSYIATIKAQSDSIKDSLENEELTQTDMNIKSEELYKLWDDALNYLWGELKNSLPEEGFKKLLAEQRIWIEEKEEAVEEASKEYKGGSIYSLVANMEAAKITEERVYEFVELLSTVGEIRARGVYNFS